jgi:3-dehydroquinate synthase
VLNYGHTLAHAVERVTGYRVRHGEAVSIGMVYVAELARLAGRLDDETAARHASVLASVGLPTRWHDAPFDDLLAVMRVDKKARGNTLRFMVLDGLARPGVLSGPSEELLRSAYSVLGRGPA